MIEWQHIVTVTKRYSCPYCDTCLHLYTHVIVFLKKVTIKVRDNPLKQKYRTILSNPN